jgi:hypothetical protein
MNRKLNLSLTFAAGLVGGLLSHYILPAPVLAQSGAPKQITAQSFVLVDEKNNTVGTFKPLQKPDEPPTVILIDKDGRELWRAGVSFSVLNSK